MRGVLTCCENDQLQDELWAAVRKRGGNRELSASRGCVIPRGNLALAAGAAEEAVEARSDAAEARSEAAEARSDAADDASPQMRQCWLIGLLCDVLRKNC